MPTPPVNNGFEEAVDDLVSRMKDRVVLNDQDDQGRRMERESHLFFLMNRGGQKHLKTEELLSFLYLRKANVKEAEFDVPPN